VKAIELKSGSSVAAEVGPLKYIAQLTGVPMASVVNYMILLLIFVFDPLAVALILITNRIFQIESDEETNNDDKNIKVENVETQNKPNFKEKKYESLGVTTRERDNDVLEEPIEYYKDEIIEQPIFENILDPVDEIVVEETGEIQLPEEPLEVKQEIWLPTPQEDEEEHDELHSFDMVMNHILGDDDEVVEIEEIIPIEEENSLPKSKIALEDIKEIKERNRGFSVNVPEPKRNNMIQRVGRK
jgi:hypothetical protein